MTAPKDDGDPLLAMAVRLEGGLRRVTEAIVQETRSRRLGTVIMTIALIIATCGAGIGIYSAISARQLANCTSDWANASSSRSQQLTKTTNARNDANNEFNLAVADLASKISLIPSNQTAFQKSVAHLNLVSVKLKKADAAYDSSLKAHPLSALADKLNC